MPLYLKNSQMLLAVFDAEYIKRLWCVFEIAMYLKLRENPNVVFINTSQKMFEIFSVTARLLVFLIVLIYNRISMSRSEASSGSDDWFMWFRFISNVVIACVQFFLGQRWFKDMISLRETISTYDVRDAQLGQQSDRLLLLQVINHYWGEDQQAGGAIHDSEEANQNVNDRDQSTRRSGTITSGLRKFNDSIRNQVRRVLPVAGPRSWILFSYCAAVLFNCPLILNELTKK